MLNADTLDFTAYTTGSGLPGPADALARLARRYLEQGYHLTDGLAWPFDKPNNRLADAAQIEARLAAAADFKQRRRTLNFWRAPFEFSLRLLQPLPHGFSWTISTQTDTLLGGANELGEQNSRTLVNVVRTALEVLPAFYGSLFALQDPPAAEQVLALAVATVYPINYFGPAYSDKIGRSILQVLQAWLVEPLGEGFLVVPSLKAIYADDLPALKAAQKQLFGNEAVRLE